MRHLRLGWVLVSLGLTACADPVQGELLIEDDQGQSMVFAPRACADGEGLGSFGVELRDDDDRVLEFFEDSGPTLIYYAPGHGAFELDPTTCDAFGGALRREFNATTDNGRVSGDLSIECTTPNGWWVEGALSFDECYAEDDDDDCDDP